MRYNIVFFFFLLLSLAHTQCQTFQNDHQNEQQGHSIQIPLPLHLDTSNRTNHVPSLNSTSIAVSSSDSRSMILSLENNVNVVSNIIRDSENLVKIKCGQCRKVSKLNYISTYFPSLSGDLVLIELERNSCRYRT